MSAAQHTPGPWRLDGEEFTRAGYLGGIYIAHQDGGRIGQTFANCLVATDEACRANARLIAAAPELLAALQFYADPQRWDDFRSDEMAVPFDRNTGSALGDDGGQVARAAIARATGGAA